MKSKITRILLSAAIAISVWFYVVTIISPNSDKQFYNIPVDDSSKVRLHDQQLMIVDMDETEVNVHLEGNRIDLNKLSSDKIQVSLDVSNIYEIGVHEAPVEISNIPEGISVRSKSPSTITVEVVERAGKPVPVDVEYGDTKVKDGYVPDKENKVLDIAEVEIAGPADVVAQVEYAQISVDLTGRTESVSDYFTHTLCDKDGNPVDAKHITVSTQEIKLELPILRLKEIPLTLKQILPGGGATEQNTAITFNPETIWVSGSEEALEDLDKLELGVLNLAEVIQSGPVTFPIKLKEGLTCESGITEATVEVKLPELETRTVTVRNIVAENVPAGMSAKLLARELQVELRGPKDKLDALDVSSLQIKVDFTDTEVGAVKRKAEVAGLDSAIGPLGNYTVSANVTQAG